MGLPIICDLTISVDWSLIFPVSFFGPDPCKWFGCPPPIGELPGPGGGGGQQCGILGCNGYCYDPSGLGCEPCPPEICNGPKCTLPGGCGPKPGIDPTPVPSRKPKDPNECEEKEKTTVTERMVSCFEDLELMPTTIASINYTQTETITSACVTFEATNSACGLMGYSTTTTVSSFTSTSSEAPACSRAPLDLNNDEGDNPQPPRTTDGPTCTRAPLSLDDDEGDNLHPEESPSCSRAPLSLDDDEGDNEQPEEGPSCQLAPLSLDDDEGDNSQPTSSEAPACTRAPLSLDDDEGNNELPDDMLPSNGTISWSSSMPMTSTSVNVPSGNPNPSCAECDTHFSRCGAQMARMQWSVLSSASQRCALTARAPTLVRMVHVGPRLVPRRCLTTSKQPNQHSDSPQS